MIAECKFMDIYIRKIRESDRGAVIDMMRGFYASNAVMTNGSEEIFAADVSACLESGMPLDGYVFESCDGETVGYGMIARSFSTEFGKPCAWIEDIFIKEDFRGGGIGAAFLDFAEREYRGYIFRLEVEEENKRAVHVYEKSGYSRMGYTEMIKR